jgi:acyl carrier protein
LLAGIWAKVMGVNRVGVEDNIFEVGGHSLLAAQVISRVRDAFRVEIGLRSLFEEPTIAALARVLEEREHQSDALRLGSMILPVSRDSYRTRLSAQGSLAIPEAIKRGLKSAR